MRRSILLSSRAEDARSHICFHRSALQELFWRGRSHQNTCCLKMWTLQGPDPAHRTARAHPQKKSGSYSRPSRRPLSRRARDASLPLSGDTLYVSDLRLSSVPYPARKGVLNTPAPTCQHNSSSPRHERNICCSFRCICR